MRRSKVFLAGLTTLALWSSLWGCGGGGGTAAPSGNPLANGRAALNRVASGKQAADTPTLQSILTLFQQALQQDPNSSEAHFGIAICLAGVVGEGVDGQPDVSGGSSGSGSSGSGSVGGGTPAVLAPTVPPGGGSGNSGFTVPSPPNSGDVPPAPPGHTLPSQPIPPHHTLGLIWNLDRGLSSPYTLLHLLSPVGDLREGLVPFYGYPSDAQDVTRRQKLLTDLGTVLQNLQAVEADPNFSTRLPDVDRNGQAVTVGLPEVYLFDAYVNSLRAEIALSLAYNRDPGSFNLLPGTVIPATTPGDLPPAPPAFVSTVIAPGNGPGTLPFISPYLQLDKNQDGKLTPDEYLPPSPFLTLRDASLLQMAQQSMLAVVDKEQKGIDGVFARPADGVFLIPNSANVHALLMEVRDHVLPLIQQAATGPVTLEIPIYQPIPLAAQAGNSGAGAVAAPRSPFKGGLFALHSVDGGAGDLPPAPPVFTTQKITINVAAWFAKPPADLKAFAPTYTLDSSGFPDFSKTTYPDPTFGGLYPEGVPSDLRF